jgi:protein-tyrosine phosphatase
MNNLSTHPDKHPVEDAYWVIPGRLMAGAYPARQFNETETQKRIYRLLNAGILSFVNLTGDGELPSYESTLHEQAGLLDRPAEYHHMPVTDMGLPGAEQMREILDVIDAAIGRGKAVYVHCRAGIGRTGTVVGCYLARHGMPGAEALNTIALMRVGLPEGWMRSPETDEQVEFVLNWPVGR